ncbi:hypothetical protein EU513_13915 [Yimella sp. RIT 621]|uniref:hypothetical protein n=1 Tax=Yimella sp. RIT 621 TaxID=2510323 RepID=UPI00101C6185|nr:hypothetical protein [Yimella sp. RIT 621]RYG76141.1 hypothetical protein EU513_13915 [Yimella sp. RIT 621]
MNIVATKENRERPDLVEPSLDEAYFLIGEGQETSPPTDGPELRSVPSEESWTEQGLGFSLGNLSRFYNPVLDRWEDAAVKSD